MTIAHAQRSPRQHIVLASAQARDLALERARWLLPADRLLVELSLRHGVPERRIAQLVHQAPGNVCRRLQRILRRLASPVCVTLLASDCSLAEDLRQLGIEHFLQGQSTRELAQRHQLSIHQTRRMLQTIQIWHRCTMGLERQPS